MFSAVHPTTDIAQILRQVRFVPVCDITPFIRSPRRGGLTASAAPSALAVLRLTTSSNLFACCTGPLQGRRGALLNRHLHRNCRCAGSRRPLTCCFDGKSIANLISSLRRV